MKHAPTLKPHSEGWLELRVDFHCETRYGSIKIKKGTKWNGSNIPVMAQIPLGLARFSTRLLGPSLVHDHGYGRKRFTREQYDQIYYDMMIENGVGKRAARWSYKALWRFGGKAWKAASNELVK